MASLPRFRFPSHSDPEGAPCTKERPLIRLPHRLPLPSLHQYQRSEPLRTPPEESPSRSRSFTMGAPHQHDSGDMTPPSTPTKPSHSKTSSGSSITDALSGLRRGNSTHSHARTDSSGSEPITFPHWLIDYEILVDGKGVKKSLGTGLWSDVYLAKPCVPRLAGQAPVSVGPDMTPPITPRSRTSSISREQLPRIPPAYAIKAPASRSAHKVLGEEACILSYLSHFPDSNNHIVPFYGLDTRTSSLVLKAMDGTLESWIESSLNTVTKTARTELLANIFPRLALSLLDSLIWLQDKSCIHADIKPSNILYIASTSPASSPQALFSDFSSAITSRPTDADAPPSEPLGGGTWDYLDPVILTKTSAGVYPAPTQMSDLWSLATTLLVVALGSSPFDSIDNKFLKLDCVKNGTPLQYADLKPVDALSAILGFDMKAWFAKVLRKDVKARVSIREWRDEFERAVCRKSKM